MSALIPFKRGDKVRLAKDQGPHRRHFPSDQDAIIIGRYDEMYGGSDTDSYSIILCETGEKCSWYHYDNMVFVCHIGELGIEVARAKRHIVKHEEGA